MPKFSKKEVKVLAKDGVIIKIDGDDSGFKSTLSGIGSTAKKGLGVAVKSIAAVGAAFTGATVAALKFSGELEQNIGGAKAVFEELGESIDKMTAPMQKYNSATGEIVESTETLETVSKKAYANMGLSQSDYLATVNKMGSLMKGTGMETQMALDLSARAMQRAADVASIMGIDTAWAMESIAGAAKGNFTMMDNLGVAMNDTTLNAYALEKGLGKSTRQMTNQEKVALAMEMFLERTAYAAGNYAKENETLAGSLGTAKAALKNFMSGAGDVDEVVDALTNASNVILKNLKGLAPKLVQGMGQMASQLIPKIPEVFRELLPAILSAFDELVNALTENVPHLIDMIVEGLSNPEGIIKIIESGAELAGALVKGIAEALPQLIMPLTETLVKVFFKLSESLVNIGKDLVQGLWTGFLKTQKTVSELPSQIDRMNKSLKDQKSAYDGLVKATDEKAVADMAEIARAKELYNALDGLIDANGQVDEKNRARAAFIVGELNSALGTEYQLTDFLNGKYQEMGNSIDALIQKKQAQILLEAHEEEYKQAVLNRTEAIKQQEEAYQKLAETQAIVDQKLAEGASLSAIEEADLLPGLQEAYKNAQNNVIEFSNAMATYNEAAAAAAEGNTEKVIAILDKGNNAYKLAADIATEQAKLTKEQVGQNLAEAVRKAEVAYDNLSQANNSVNQQALTDAVNYAKEIAKAYESAGGEIPAALTKALEDAANGVDGAGDALKEALKEIGTQGVEDYANSINENSGVAGEAAEKMVGDTLNKVDTTQNASDTGVTSLGTDFTSGYAKGIRDGKGEAINAAAEVATAALLAVKGAQDSNSPAKESGYLGEDFSDGYAVGIESHSGEAVRAAVDMADATLDALLNKYKYKEAAEENINSYVETFDAKKDKIGKSLKEIAETEGIGGIIDFGSSNEEEAERITRALRESLRKNGKASASFKEHYWVNPDTGEKVLTDKYTTVESDGKKIITLDQTKNGAKKSGEVSDAAKQELNDLKYLLDMKKISEAEYYEYLAEYRDKHFAEDSEEWRKYTVEMFKFQEDAREEQIAQELKDLNYAHDMKELSDKDYYDRLAEYRDKYFEEGSDEWRGYTLEIFNYYQSLIDELKSKQETIAKNLFGENKGYESYSISEGGKTKSYTKLADPSKNNQQLEKYEALLDKLLEKHKNLPEEVMNSLSQMGIDEGISYITTLLNTSDEEIKKVFAGWEEAEQRAWRISEKMTQSAKSDLEEFRKVFADEFGQEVPDEFFDIGEESAQKFGEGLKEKISGILSELRKQVINSLSFAGPRLSLSMAGVAGGTINNYTNSYTFNSSRDTTTQQLFTARNASKVDELRGEN